MFARSWRIATATAFAVGCVGWGREGRPHASLEIAGLDSDDNCNGGCLSKKKGLDKGKGEVEFKERSVFFMLSYFVIVFWLLFFNVDGLISYQDQVNCWMGFSCKISLSVVQIRWSSYYSSSSSWLFICDLLQDFPSSHPNLVIIFLIGKYSVGVICRE